MKNEEILALHGSCNAEINAATQIVKISEYGDYIASFTFDEIEAIYFKQIEAKSNFDCQKIASVSDMIKYDVLKIMLGY